MTIRDVLVQLDATEASRSRARVAADLAGRSGAQLSGVFLTSAFMRNQWAAEAAAYLPPDAIEDLLRDHAKAVADAGEKARAIFDQAAGEAGVRSDWRSLDGDSDEMMFRFARRVDLTVFPTVATACFGQHVIPAADLALSAAVPVARYVEYLTPSPYMEEIVTEPFKVDAEGFLPIPEKPGLGIELNREALKTYGF